MSNGQRVATALNRIFLVLGSLVLAAFLFWFGQEISANFDRSALIEQKDFGALRESLDEDFSGSNITTTNGEVRVYEYSIEQDFEEMYFDQASDLTIVNPATGQNLRIADDERRVVWFRQINLESAENAEDEQDSEIAFAYVARLGTREMYQQGYTDLVVGNFETFEQREIAKNIPYVDGAMRGPEPGQVSILYWDGLDSARHVIVAANDLSIVRSQKVALPDKDAFLLDLEDTLEQDREEAVERASGSERGRPKPTPSFDFSVD